MARYLMPASRLLKGISFIPALKNPKWLGNNCFSTYEQTLLNIPPTRLTVLDNGLRVASEDSSSSMATVGLWISTGSRYETDEKNGITHFVERLAYKGTKKRSQTDLEIEVENLGAQFGSYTSREHTAFFAKCLSQDVSRVIEILSDIIQNGKLGEQEIEKEKEIILNEMEEVEGNLQGIVCDHLHSVAFQGTPLARTVLGTSQNIKKLNRQDLVNHIDLHYKAPRIVLAGSGGVEHDALVSLAKEHFKGLSQDDSEIPKLEACRFTGSEVRVRDDDLPVAHIAIAFEGVDYSDPDYIPLMIAKTIVGSYDRTYGGGIHNSSRLARVAAATPGCHCFQSFITSYKDTGLFGIYFVCERLSIEEFVLDLQAEWMRLCTDLTDFEVERGKNTLLTSLLLQLDGTAQTCEDIGRQILYNGRRVPFHELDSQIQAVNTEVIKDVMYKHIYDRCPAVSGVGPVEQLPDYNNMRSGFYRLRL